MPGSSRAQTATVLVLHAGLGVLAYQALEWVTRGIQQENPIPQRFAWIFGIPLPIIVFLIATAALHRRWFPRHPVISALIAGLVVLAHVAGWRAGYRR